MFNFILSNLFSQKTNNINYSPYNRYHLHIHLKEEFSDLLIKLFIKLIFDLSKINFIF
jgi:hypothetical protein